MTLTELVPGQLDEAALSAIETPTDLSALMPVAVRQLSGAAALSFFEVNGYDEVSPEDWKHGGVYAAIPGGGLMEFGTDDKGRFNVEPGLVEAVTIVRHHQFAEGDRRRGSARYLNAAYYPNTASAPSEGVRPALEKTVTSLAQEVGARVLVGVASLNRTTRSAF